MDDAANPTLPDDVEVLKAMCLTLTREREMLMRERDAAARRADQLAARNARVEAANARIEAELLRLRKIYYGPRADNFTTQDQFDQLMLEFASHIESRPVDARDLLQEDRGEKEPRRLRPSRGHGRRRIANIDHLPTRTVEHDLPEADKPCPCCGEVRRRIDSESSWQIEFIPGRFERINHVRHTYACSACEKRSQDPRIVTAPKPLGTEVVEKGMAGPGLVAYIVTSKYTDYLPLYRLQGIFERSGLALSRANLCAWCRDAAEIVLPLCRRMKERVLESHVIGTDDTTMPMQEQGQCRSARMWIYSGDDDHPYNIFDFTLSRARDGPMRLLSGYRGTLLADAYGGYDGVVVHNAMTRAGCWAHARRKFADAGDDHPAIAAEARSLIGALFAVEARIKDMHAAARTRARAEESALILARLRERLVAWQQLLLPKQPMMQAVRYALNQWEELNVISRDQRVPIDNNAAEREMKRIAINRKNSLFVGNQRGGETMAVLASLTSTCRRHGIDPQRYLAHLLVNLPHSPARDLDRWLPDIWKRTHAHHATQP